MDNLKDTIKKMSRNKLEDTTIKLYENLLNMCDSAELMSIWDKTPNDAYYKAKFFLKTIK
jgi:hypothetical protein